MKARICQMCKGGLYYGQIYDKKHKCWETVTLSCFTEWGAKRELKEWVKQNCPQEFDI